MMIEITKRIRAISIDCQRKIVSLNGITPVIGSRLGGRLFGLA